MSFAFLSHLRRSAAPLLLLLTLAACSTDALTPRADIDGDTQVNSIVPMEAGDTGGDVSAYPSNDMPVSDAGENADDAVSADPRRDTRRSQGLEQSQTQQQKRLPMIDSEPDAMPKIDGVGEVTPSEIAGSQGGVNMDAMLGVEPVVGLAEEQRREIAEGSASQPVVDGIGSENPQQIGTPVLIEPDSDAGLADMMPEETQSMMRGPGEQPIFEDGQREQQVAFIPRLEDPLQAMPEEQPDVMPSSEVSCRKNLKKLGVKFRDIPRISKGRSCGIDYPIELIGLSGGVQIKPAAKLNCQVSVAFAQWVRNELVPSSRVRYLSGVKAIHQMSSYSCRTMNSARGNPMSEHAHGNAIDIGKIVLKSGKEIDVRKKSFFAFREKGLLKAVRDDSCKYFSTVLGPGSDRNHKDHFHFDLRARKSGYRHCS
ncbi:extensin-like domain-containing protein [Pararhizobium sp.]|uniref:extensin-like domain-containing protein n=1 Tax=Pararhizobium sp. TaxID=1977563 RepID=UPI0027260AD2|nr:extensin family protein [Pararhizobium sp.]MDO9418995.1 extensin family protein [Pararhizobium sp.]